MATTTTIACPYTAQPWNSIKAGTAINAAASTNTLKECQSLCTSDANCKAYEFDSINSLCNYGTSNEMGGVKENTTLFIKDETCTKPETKHDATKCFENNKYDNDCCAVKNQNACIDNYFVGWGEVCYEGNGWTAHKYTCTYQELTADDDEYYGGECYNLIKQKNNQTANSLYCEYTLTRNNLKYGPYVNTIDTTGSTGPQSCSDLPLCADYEGADTLLQMPMFAAAFLVFAYTFM